MMPEETTLVLIKPHDVYRRQITPILSLLDTDNLRITGIKMIRPSLQMVEDHYQEHAGKDYFPWLCEQLDDQPVVAIAISGKNAVKRIRGIVGPTKPEDNSSYTIRGKFSDDTFEASRREKRAVRNVVHAVSSLEDAERELKIWFRAEELLT
ncbi:MAG: nucleoside-diphosphate kinase [Patescibacteria group bacterium]|jgi:nucleoside-diphosphate kinase